MCVPICTDVATGAISEDERLRRAYLCLQQRDFAGAAAACQALLTALPDHPEGLALAGKLALQSGRPEQASRYLRRAAAVAPPSYDVLSSLGASCVQLRRFAEAAAVFVHALELRPAHPPAHLNLAAAHRGMGEFDKAIAVLTPLAEGAAPNDVVLTELATLHALIGNPAIAIDFYRRAVAAAPQAAAPRRALAQLLTRQGRAAEAVEHYRELAAALPQEPALQTDLGVALAAAGAAEEAVRTLRRALAGNPDDKVARAALGQLFRDEVPAWHFPMMNHVLRNAAYDAAIRRAITPESLVLDIGAGGGLLALMAARAGARHVYACETRPLIAEKAREIVQANGLADRITIIAKHSSQLRIGEDLPRKVDVLVSEIVDAGLIGEGILLTLGHARRELVAENAAIIPRAGTLSAMLVESEALWHQDRVQITAGFDTAAFNEFSRYGLRTLNVKHFDHRLLSRPAELFRFDLTAAGFRPEARVIELPVRRSGTCHALMSWFDMNLDDRERVSSGPAAGPLDWHWMQVFHFWDPPRRVSSGETVRIAASHDLLHVVVSLDGGRPA